MQAYLIGSSSQRARAIGIRMIRSQRLLMTPNQVFNQVSADLFR